MNWLRSLFTRKRPDRVAIAHAARVKAAREYAIAVALDRTQDQHHALLRLKRARMQELAAELGWL